MVTGKDVVMSVGILAVTAAVVGFIGAYAAVKGAQMAGGIPMGAVATAMRQGDAMNPRFRHAGVPGGYGAGSHPNLL